MEGIKMSRPSNMIYGFWDRLEEELYKQNKTKKEIASNCGFNRRVLDGDTNLSLPYVALICKELNISVDYLLFGKKK